MILDEFYSLGRMSQAQTAAAQMRKFGLHMWPFLQDWGQLVELYSKEGAQAFTANAEAICAFGIGDHETAEQFSKWLGNHAVNSAMAHFPIAPPFKAPDGAAETKRMQREKLFQMQSEFLQNVDMRRIGTPLISPQDLRSMLAKKEGAAVADKMLVILKDQAIMLQPEAHFEPQKNDEVSQKTSFKLYFILIAIFGGIYPAFGAFIWSGSVEVALKAYGLTCLIGVAIIWWEDRRSTRRESLSEI